MFWKLIFSFQFFPDYIIPIFRLKKKYYIPIFSFFQTITFKNIYNCAADKIIRRVPHHHFISQKIKRNSISIPLNYRYLILCFLLSVSISSISLSLCPLKWKYQRNNSTTVKPRWSLSTKRNLSTRILMN